MKSKLKPCPFCGGEASVNITKYHAESDVAKLNGQASFYGVNCVSCGADTRGLVGSKTEEEAIRAWNRRAPELAAENDKLKAENARLRGALEWVLESSQLWRGTDRCESAILDEIYQEGASEFDEGEYFIKLSLADDFLDKIISRAEAALKGKD